MSTKSCMTFLGILLGSTALISLPSTAEAALKGYLGNVRPLSDWKIGQVKAPTEQMPGYCASVNQFEKGIVLALAQNQDGHLSLAIDFARPRFRPGQTHTVNLTHADGYAVRASGLAVNNKSLVIQLGQDPVFLQALAQEGHLMISLSDVEMKVSLMTFSNSAQRLEDCLGNLPEHDVMIQDAKATAPAVPAPDVEEDKVIANAEPVQPAIEPKPENKETSQVDPVPKKQPETQVIALKASDIIWNEAKPLPEDTPDMVAIPVKEVEATELPEKENVSVASSSSDLESEFVPVNMPVSEPVVPKYEAEALELSNLNDKVEQKRSELESLQVAMAEQRKLQKAYQEELIQENLALNTAAAEAPKPEAPQKVEITWNTPPVAQAAETWAQEEAVMPAAPAAPLDKAKAKTSAAPIASAQTRERDLGIFTPETEPVKTAEAKAEPVVSSDQAEIEAPKTEPLVELAAHTTPEMPEREHAGSYETASNEAPSDAKSLVTGLMKRHQTRSGRTDDVMHLNREINSVHEVSGLAIYQQQGISAPVRSERSFFLQKFEPASGRVETYVEDKAVMTETVEHALGNVSHEVSLDRAQMLNASLQKLLVNANVSVETYTDDMRHDGVGYQRNWQTAGLEGQFALYENMESDKFMTYVGNFLTAYEAQNCNGASLSHQLYMASNDVVTADLSCEEENTYGGIVFFKDDKNNLSIITHRGGADAMNAVRGMTAALTANLMQGRNDAHIVDHSAAMDSEEI